MPLVMSMREGDKVFVDDEPIMLERICEEGHIQVEVDGAVYDIVDDRAVEVIEDVWVSIGDRRGGVGTSGHVSRFAPAEIRVSIDAPRTKLILREARYREALSEG